MERGVQYAVCIYVIKALPILYMYQEICKKEEMEEMQSCSCHFDFLNPPMPVSAKILFIYFHLNASDSNQLWAVHNNKHIKKEYRILAKKSVKITQNNSNPATK